MIRAWSQQVSQSVSAQRMHQHPLLNRSSADADFALRSPERSAAKAYP